MLIISEGHTPESATAACRYNGHFQRQGTKGSGKQIQQTEAELNEKLDKLPDILTDDGYPGVQAFMKTYRKAEAIVTQYNQELAEWEQAAGNGQKPALRSYIYGLLTKTGSDFCIIFFYESQDYF